MPKNATYPDCLDEAKQICITKFRQWGYLEPFGWKSGTISWSCGGHHTGSIRITVDMQAENLELNYSSNGEPVNYRVRLESVVSNLGKGRVWYFICPVTGRRCRKLYGVGKHFLSRFAYPSAMYSQQTKAKGWRDLSAALGVIAGRDVRLELITKRYAKTWYNGKPTRRFQRILDREDRALKRFAEKDPTLCLRFPKRIARLVEA